MLTLAEIVRSVYGTWRLAHLDPGGMAFFDRTEEGFWRSFRVAILVAPAYALLVALDYATPPADPAAAVVTVSLFRVVAIESIAYAIEWMAFPLAAYYLVSALGREREYIGFIVAYNWSSVLQVGVMLLVGVIGASGLLPRVLETMLGLGTWALLLAYSWFIAKTALNTTGLPAAGLVAMNVMISFLLVFVRQAMLL
jgi:hypothetical protein